MLCQEAWANLCLCGPCGWPYGAAAPGAHPARPPPRPSDRQARRAHLEQLEHDDGLQDALVVLQQAALRDAGPAHDVVQHGLHHALAHRRVQVAVHDAPRAADEADVLTVPAGRGDSPLTRSPSSNGTLRLREVQGLAQVTG